MQSKSSNPQLLSLTKLTPYHSGGQVFLYHYYTGILDLVYLSISHLNRVS